MAWLRKSPTHRSSTRNTEAINPFVSTGGLGTSIYIGVDGTGGAFCFDPWALYPHVLTNPNMAMFGEVGAGKSSLAKTYVYRQAAFNRQSWIVDPKGEWSPIAERLGCRPLKLEPDGDMRLNPLDRGAGLLGQMQLLQSVGEVALRRELTPEEGKLCSHLLKQWWEQDLEPTLPMVVEALLNPTEATAAVMKLPLDRVLEEGRKLAYAISRLVDGDLAGMFDGPTTEGLDLSNQPCVVLDISAVFNSAALSLIMMCAISWLRAALRREAESDDKVQRVMVVDECWAMLEDEANLAFMQDGIKRSRHYGMAWMLIAHRPSDFYAAATEGSRAAKLAEGLLKDVGTMVCYQQKRKELESACSVLGIDEAEAEELIDQRRGEALWIVNGQTHMVTHMVGTAEWALVDTDAAMRVHNERAALAAALQIDDDELESDAVLA